MRLIDADALLRNTVYNTLRAPYITGRDVEEAPTVEAELVRHGKWIGTEYDGYADGVPVYNEWICSNCNWAIEDEEPTYNYCPNCGAKMDGEDEKNDN